MFFLGYYRWKLNGKVISIHYQRARAESSCPFLSFFSFRSLSFEKAYAEYRLNRTKEALKTLQAISEPTDRDNELLGQVVSTGAEVTHLQRQEGILRIS